MVNTTARILATTSGIRGVGLGRRTMAAHATTSVIGLSARTPKSDSIAHSHAIRTHETMQRKTQADFSAAEAVRARPTRWSASLPMRSTPALVDQPIHRAKLRIDASNQKIRGMGRLQRAF